MGERAERERPYQRQAERAARAEAAETRRSEHYSRLRLALFLAATALLVAGTLGRTSMSWPFVAAALAGYGAFAAAVALHARVEHERARAVARRECAEISLALDWYPWSNHTGIFMALENGYFEEEGLDVEVNVPADPTTALQLVATGSDDFTISYQADVLYARSQGNAELVFGTELRTSSGPFVSHSVGRSSSRTTCLFDKSAIPPELRACAVRQLSAAPFPVSTDPR